MGPQICRASRWFSSSEVQQGLTASLTTASIHLSRAPSAADSTKALATLRLDRGPLIEASRMTPNGLLAWRITVRDDNVC
jgi:hypothetical protein